MSQLELTEIPQDGHFTTVGAITPLLAKNAFQAVQKQCRKAGDLLGRDTVLVIMTVLMERFEMSEEEVAEVQEYVQEEMFDADSQVE